MPKRKEKSANDSENKEKIAFVIAPIGKSGSEIRKRSDKILRHVISEVLEEFGYKAIRADEIDKPGLITVQVINHVLTAPLVVTDLTGHNPNVLYELALRHAAKLPVVQLIKSDEELPFDIADQRTIKIDHTDLDSVAEAKEKLRAQIHAVEKDPSLVDSPLSLAVNFQGLRQSGNAEQKAITGLKDVILDMSTRIRAIEARQESEMLKVSSAQGTFGFRTFGPDEIIYTPEYSGSVELHKILADYSKQLGEMRDQQTKQRRRAKKKTSKKDDRT